MFLFRRRIEGRKIGFWISFSGSSFWGVMGRVFFGFRDFFGMRNLYF